MLCIFSKSIHALLKQIMKNVKRQVKKKSG